MSTQTTPPLGTLFAKRFDDARRELRRAPRWGS